MLSVCHPHQTKLVNLLNQNVFHSLSFICLAYKPKEQETYKYHKGSFISIEHNIIALLLTAHIDWFV